MNPGALGPYGAFGAGVGAGSYMGVGMPLSASDQLREASDRLRKLQATAAGPPPLKDVITVRLCNDACVTFYCSDAVPKVPWLADSPVRQEKYSIANQCRTTSIGSPSFASS